MLERINMEKENTLSVDNICSIINACSQNGVTELEFGDLKVSFKDNKKTVEPIVVPNTFHGPESNQQNIEPVTVIEEDLDPEYNIDLERDLKGLEAQNAILENPELAEQLEFMDDEEVEQFLANLMGEKDHERS